MQIKFSASQNNKNHSAVITTNNKLQFGSFASNLDSKTDGALKKAIQSQKFTGKFNEIINIIAPNNLEYDNVVIIGLGETAELDNFKASSVGGEIYSALKSLKAEKAEILLDKFKNSSEFAAHILYGIKQKSYSFDKYKSVKKDDKKYNLSTINIQSEDIKITKNNFAILDKISDGVFLSRDLVSEPSNELHPESYAKIIKSELTKLGVKVKILKEKEMYKLGMGSLLGVGQGSIRESHLVIMEWMGDKKSKKTPLALVGKGVTFDTGGISIKPSLGMEDMKYDMGGSAAVVGAMKAIAGRKAKANVIGVVGLVENMPDGNAQRPGDVVKSMSGQTIEVLNTDAEGRLVLADALWYAQEKYKPDTIIDLATLTGAIVISFGSEYAGLFSNDDKLSEQLSASSLEEEEKLWRMPIGKAYDKMIDSDIADIRNISSGRGAGSITAAQFLKRFIQDGVKWAHLDIAGVAWTKQDQSICPKGATGFGVKLLNNFVAKNYG